MLVFLIITFGLFLLFIGVAVKWDCGVDDGINALWVIPIVLFIIGIGGSFFIYEKKEYDYIYNPLAYREINDNNVSLYNEIHVNVIKDLTIGQKIFYRKVKFYYVTYKAKNFWGYEYNDLKYYYIYINDNKTNKGLN